MSKPKDGVRPPPHKISQAPPPIRPTEGGGAVPRYYHPTKLDVTYAADLALWSDRYTTCFILGIMPSSRDKIAQFEPSYLDRFQRYMKMIELTVKAGELEPHYRGDSVLHFEPRKIIEWVERKQSIVLSKEWKKLVRTVTKLKAGTRKVKQAVGDQNDYRPSQDSAEVDDVRKLSKKLANKRWSDHKMLIDRACVDARERWRQGDKRDHAEMAQFLTENTENEKGEAVLTKVSEKSLRKALAGVARGINPSLVKGTAEYRKRT